MPTSLKIDDRIDPKSLVAAFQLKNRLHVPNFFESGFAKQVSDALVGDVPWARTLVFQGRGVEAPLAGFSSQHPRRFELEAHIADTARKHSFQYQYDAWRLSETLEAGKRSGGALAPIEAVYDFLNSEAFLAFVRELTGDPAPAYCDAHVTRYSAGHFLKTHHDGNVDTARLYAYVLNFTPDWQTDWGGILQFQNDARDVTEGYPPRFNALNIFRVPQWHAVSQVASYVTAHRYSITGWVRSRRHREVAAG